jgi:hypothetical protein
MNKLLNFTKWALTATAIVALVVIYSCSNEDEPLESPEFSYADATVEVGSAGTVTPTITGGAATYQILDDGGADFVSINANTGVLSVAAESTTGEYTITVSGMNATSNSTATAGITIGVSGDFNPAGESLLWKYWMNNTEGIVMENLNTLPGQEGLPPAIPIPAGWPGETPFQIDPMDPELEGYLVFPTVQYFLLQVPGDDVCGALDPAENGDTLLLIVNSDLTLSTLCRNEDSSPGTTVDLGTSTISYSNDAYTWTLNLTLQGVPVSYVIGNAVITDFTDPLDPHWTAPSGTPRTFSSVQGTVEQYLTPTDFADYLGSLQLLNVDVVLEIL